MQVIHNELDGLDPTNTRRDTIKADWIGFKELLCDDLLRWMEHYHLIFSGAFDLYDCDLLFSLII